MTEPLLVHPDFHAATGTWSYVLSRGRDAVVIDPVLDYEAASGRIATDSARRLLGHVREHDLHVHHILETHAHADHLSAAAFIKAMTSAAIAIGGGIRSVQGHFAGVFGIDAGAAVLANAFDETLADGDVIHAGGLRIEVMATPGHTPDGVSYRIDDQVFIGDTLFAPDIGTARCDFPGGSVEQLFATIQRLHALPDDTTLWLCHDYPPAGRRPRASMEVVESRRDNRMLTATTPLAEFVAARTARDATLPAPALLYPALQVNIRGGRLPEAIDGRVFLRTPVALAPPVDGLIADAPR